MDGQCNTYGINANAEISVKQVKKKFASAKCRWECKEISYEHMIGSHLRALFLEVNRVNNFYSWRCHTLFRIIILYCFYRTNLFESQSFGSRFCLHLQLNRITDKTHYFIFLSRDTHQPWPCFMDLPMGRTKNVVFLIVFAWKRN
jgi:hypothetical protein